jgi:hypothetical protein
MVNGLEDPSEMKTGVRLPEWFLVHLSGMVGFVCYQNEKTPAGASAIRRYIA